MTEAPSMIDIQSDPETVAQLKRIIAELKASSATDGFIVSLLKHQDDITRGHADLTACFISIKKDVAELDKKLAVIEAKLGITNSIGGKIGLMMVGGIFTSIMGLIAWLITKRP